MIVRTGIVIALVAVIGVIGYLVLSSTSFSTYVIAKEIEKNDDSSLKYSEFNGNIIRYSHDGISYMDYNGKELWNQTYEMQNPVLDINGESAVIADQNGNHVFVFDADGIQGEFETKLPIEKIRISQQGLTAILMKDDTVNWLNYYDKTGTEIAENRTSLANSGYPLDFAVSPDGTKIVISYLNITDMSTQIAFYNFDSVGQEAIDNLVSARTYEDMIIPKLQFLSNDISYAVGTDRLILFKGKEIPDVSKEITFTQEIKSVFSNERYIGLVLTNDSSDDRYDMVVYNSSGDQVFTTSFSSDIKDVHFGTDNIILHGSTKLTIINMRGKIQFEQNLDGNVQTVATMTGFQKYAIIYDNRVEHIKLRWQGFWS